MAFYPPAINERFRSSKHLGGTEAANAVGTAATLVCGSFVRFSLNINNGLKKVSSAKFQTNGCGFMITAAEVIAHEITNRPLADLHGLDDEWLNRLVVEKLESFGPERLHCQKVCFEAVQAAFSDYRALQIEEFQGEKALICTCFGVAEETVERVISESSITSVEDLADLCKAGSGCGSCRMLIQEMIDAADEVRNRSERQESRG